jgi:phospholipid/cholesterol/gamma-HCH transport system substrate-binding protein
VKYKKEVIIGLVTTLALACFFYGFNFLKGKNFFTHQRKFYALYNNVDGLVEANPLMISGFRVGTVGDIQFMPGSKGQVVVTMIMNDEIQLPYNSVAKVISSDLLGSKAIQILLGNSSELADNGDTLLAAQEDNLKEAVNKTIEPLQKKAQSLISSLDSVLVTVQAVFNESTRKNLQNSFQSIKDAITSLEVTSYRLDTMVVSEKVKISSILTKINILATSLANNSDKLSNVINNFSAISDSIAKSNLKQAINNADVALNQASSILTKINSGQGSLGLLVNNDSLYRKLDKSSDDLDKLLKDLRLHPNRYINIRNKREPYKE